MCSWNHLCQLDSLTLHCLFQNQGAKLRDLRFKGCRRLPNNSIPSKQGLETFCNYEINRSNCPDELLARNWQTLRNLHLGLENYIAEQYASDHADPNFDQMTDGAGTSRDRSTGVTSDCGNDVENKLLGLGHSTIPMLSLEELRLCGLDLGILALSPIATRVDFTNLTTLRLESCLDLDDTLRRLIESGGLSFGAKCVPRLKSFLLRQERCSPLFRKRLGTFLCSFSGLQHLHVLLEGSATWRVLGPILILHGKSLQTLVWDQRSGPRIAPGASLSVYAKGFECLETISNLCPNLIGLGVPLDWNQISTQKHRDTVSYSVA